MPPTTTDDWEDIEIELCSTAREACSFAFDPSADEDVTEAPSGDASATQDVRAG
jgi:hypothetical protein